MPEPECVGCYYNRPMMAWGERVQACFHGVDVGGDLYGDDGCSGYEETNKQLEIDFTEGRG